MFVFLFKRKKEKENVSRCIDPVTVLAKETKITQGRIFPFNQYSVLKRVVTILFPLISILFSEGELKFFSLLSVFCF